MLALALSMTALSAEANIFKFEHNDTISSLTGTGLTVGQSAKITVALDNGGTSLNSQTWTPADLQWVRYDFNNGAVLTTFTPPFGGDGWVFSSGNFTTDASGVLLSVVATWFDNSVGTDYSTNIGTPLIWRLSNVPLVYNNTTTGAVSLTNASTIPTVGGWQAVADAPVPEPSSLALLAMGAAAGFRRWARR